MNQLSTITVPSNASRGSLATIAGRQGLTLERIIRARRRRRAFFPTHLFSDPAGDMLLKLAQAEFEQQRVTVSELCTAAGTP